MKKTSVEKGQENPKIPPQHITGYNRDSGKKTLYFVTILLVLITILTGAIIYLVSR